MRHGDKIRLLPISRHGKSRVREHGNHAVIIQTQGTRVCTKTPDGDWRWIDIYNDQDFHLSEDTEGMIWKNRD